MHYKCICRQEGPIYKGHIAPNNIMKTVSKISRWIMTISEAGIDMNPALPDTSMRVGRYVHKHELFKFSR